jgi:hypothetical protein
MCVPTGIWTGTAQEPARMSLAGQAAAAARAATASGPESYNLQLGLSKWTIAAALDFEANDNVLLEAVDQEFDVIVSPQLNTRGIWPISEKNSLNVGLGIGYSAYKLHSQFNRLFVVPGSELSWDLYIGDFLIELHDRLSIAKDAYADPTAVGGANYSQFQNAAGFSATWDLNKPLLRFGYDHSTYGELSGSGAFRNGNSDILALSAGYRWRPLTVFGVESSGGWIRYLDSSVSNGTSEDCNLGTFLEVQASQYISVKAAAGYTTYIPNDIAGSSGGTAFRGGYARLTLNHRLNRRVEYNFTGGRSINFGFYAGTLDMCSVNLDLRLYLFQKLGVLAGFGFEHGSQVGAGSETFDRFGPRVVLERPITGRISGALRYQYYQRLSNVVGAEYAINLVTLNLSYRL